MAKDNPNNAMRDHEIFPEIVLDRDVYFTNADGERELWAAQGEVLTEEQVAFAYSREGRRVLGLELPNPVPLEPPLGYFDAVPIHVQIRQMIEGEISRRAALEGEETFEEADDFDVDDDMDPMSPHELEWEPRRPWFTSVELEAQERRSLAAAERQRQVEQKLAGASPAPPPPQSPSSASPLPEAPQGNSARERAAGQGSAEGTG